MGILLIFIHGFLTETHYLTKIFFKNLNWSEIKL